MTTRRVLSILASAYSACSHDSDFVGSPPFGAVEPVQRLFSIIVILNYLSRRRSAFPGT
jgi:hypothetical protein